MVHVANKGARSRTRRTTSFLLLGLSVFVGAQSGVNCKWLEANIEYHPSRPTYKCVSQTTAIQRGFENIDTSKTR